MSNGLFENYPLEVHQSSIMKSKLKAKPRERDVTSALGRENLPFNDSSDKPCILICTHCMEKFQTKTQLKDHYRRFHKEFMDHNATNEKRLVRKINRHMCGLCSKHFADSWTLKHHQKTVHQAAREHKCPNCTKSFLSNKDMVRHFKGVHLGQKIIFPGGKRKVTKISESHIDISEGIPGVSIDTAFEHDIVTTEKKMVPNILKSSKAERKSISILAEKNNGATDLINQVVEVDKVPQFLIESNLETVDNHGNLITSKDIILEIDNEEPKELLIKENKSNQPVFQSNDEQPIFQLENLENLQFVLPEGSAEPQIIIPETGIRLTIPCGSETDGVDSREVEKQVLHLVPNQIESFQDNQPNSESIEMEGSPITTFIPLLEGTETSRPELPENCPFLVNEKSNIPSKESTVIPVASFDYPKKFVYKKVNGSASPHLVAVKDLPGKLGPAPNMQQFHCEKCNKYFISKDFLEKHHAMVHPELSTFINIFNGNLEGLGINNEDEALSNLEDIEGIIDVENFNEEDLSSNSLLKSDCEDVLLNNPIDIPDSKIECKMCGVYFNDKGAFMKHKKIAHKKPQSFKCEECSSEFTSKQTLKAHMQSFHEGIKKVCSFCLKPVADLTRHVRSQHKNEGKKDFPCDSCHTYFRTNFSLQRHKETVHLKLKAWLCDLCEKSFGEKRDMIRHKNAIHFGIKNKQSKWVCPECNVVFKLRREYDHHKTLFHANLTEEQVVKFLNSEMESKRQRIQAHSLKL